MRNGFDHASNHGGATSPLTPLVCRAVMACVARLTQVTLELVDGSRRSVPTSRLLEASDQQWADAHAAALAQKRSALELATRQAYTREQEQVAAPRTKRAKRTHAVFKTWNRSGEAGQSFHQ